MANETAIETPVATGSEVHPIEVKPVDGEVVTAFGHDVLIAKNGRPVNLAKAIILTLTSMILRSADFGKRIGSKLGMGRTNGKVKVVSAYLTDTTDDALKALLATWHAEYLKAKNGKESDNHVKRLAKMYEMIAAKVPTELGKAIRILAAFGGTLSVRTAEGVMLITMSDLLGRFLTGAGLTNVQVAKMCNVVDDD